MLDVTIQARAPNHETRDLEACLADVRLIRTLGPHGTNCERAAHFWFRNRMVDGEVVLHPTLEDGVKHLKRQDRCALLACAVYPDLHTLVFSNLEWLALADSFIIPTHNMLLASRGRDNPTTVATHPAPKGLVPQGAEIILVTSNAQAARDCADGRVDACITTQPAAEQHGLHILKDFGPVPMDFTIHLPL
jgi:prephenate dehydratase